MKTLILYASTHGATTKCVEELTRRFGRPVDVHLLSSAEGTDLAQYDEVLLGSSVQAGQLNKYLKAFCERHKQALLSKKLGLFVGCMEQENPENYLRTNLPADLVSHAAVLAKIGGGYTFSRMNFFERLLINSIANGDAKKKGLPLIDGKTDSLFFCEEGMEKLVAAFL